MNTLDSIKTAISTLIDKAIEQAPFDKTRTGIVKSVNENNNTYQVTIDGITYFNVPIWRDDVAEVGDIVKVKFPLGNVSQMYISNATGKKGMTAEQESLLTQTSNIANTALEGLSTKAPIQHNHSSANLDGLVLSGGGELFRVWNCTSDTFNTAGNTTVAVQTMSTGVHNGYRPIGIIGWQISGNTGLGQVNLFTSYISTYDDNEGVITFRFRNIGTSALSDVTISFRVLWLKIG